jgi:tRNA threonylcarbamoyladenosine biosynthesis protein TsaB
MMLAFEFSTRRASLALLDGARLVDEESWDEPLARHLHWHLALDRLLVRARRGLRDIHQYAVGRGPGAFSGIRIAVTAAQTLALPRHQPVHAVSSGEALAARVFEAHPVARVGVIGDARRGVFWFNAFSRDAQSPRPWALIRRDAVREACADAELVVTPEWDRLGASLTAEGIRCLAESISPRAQDVGRLVAARLARGGEMEPVAPLYLHPPV